MNHVRLVLFMALAAPALAAWPARAQSAPAPSAYRAYVAFDAGAEVKTQTLTVPGSFSIYGETATFTANVPINNGALINLEGGARVWRNLFASVAISWRLKSSSGSDVSASVPHPLFVSAPRTTSANVTPLENYGSALHLSAGWEFNAARKVQLRVFGGVSVFGVKQDVVNTISVQEGSAPFSTVTVSGATLTRLSKFGAPGYNIGLSGTYMFSRNLGAGILLRFSGGTIDLAGPGNVTLSVDAGGFDGGLGVRVRF